VLIANFGVGTGLVFFLQFLQQFNQLRVKTLMIAPHQLRIKTLMIAPHQLRVKRWWWH